MEKEAWTRPRILIVDDDEELLMLLRTYFEARFYEVHTAATAEQGLAHVQMYPVDVILLDENLPDEMGQTILPVFMDLSQAPVLMISSDADPTIESHSRMLGAAGFMTKPFSTTALARRVHLLLPEIAR